MIRLFFRTWEKPLNLVNNMTPKQRQSSKSKAFSLFFGGLLPIIAFTVIEEKYGIIAGLIAGMIFGLGEIIYEYITVKKVSTITWIGNGLILGLGGISLISNEGVWFKLQPAILEFGFFIFLSFLSRCSPFAIYFFYYYLFLIL